MLTQAILESLAFSFMDCQQALINAKATINRLCVTGGGAHSRYWLQLIATLLQRPLQCSSIAQQGPAFGAALLARMADTGSSSLSIKTDKNIIEPKTEWYSTLVNRYQRYKNSYQQLASQFAGEFA